MGQQIINQILGMGLLLFVSVLGFDFVFSTKFKAIRLLGGTGRRVFFFLLTRLVPFLLPLLKGTGKLIWCGIRALHQKIKNRRQRRRKL